MAPGSCVYIYVTRMLPTRHLRLVEREPSIMAGRAGFVGATADSDAGDAAFRVEARRC